MRGGPPQLQVYTLKNTMSRLVGTGSLEGELYLNHMPVSQSKRFQIGLGANNHNCDFGFGGWFGWHGVLNGASVAGLTGDIVANATLPEFEAPGCNDEHVELVYATVDPVVGSSQQVVQRWERLDTTAPVFLGAPQDQTLEWSEVVGEDCNTWSIEVPCVEIDDNCSGWNPEYPGCAETPENPCGEVLFSQQVYEGDCTTQFQVVRTWTAIDAAGNSAQHTQVITVQDTEGPSFDNVPIDLTIACGDLNHIPAMPEDCAGVDLSFTQTVAEEVAAVRVDRADVHRRRRMRQRKHVPADPSHRGRRSACCGLGRSPLGHVLRHVQRGQRLRLDRVRLQLASLV